MFEVDFQNRTPIFEQIESQVEKYILSGILKPEDKLPSIRELTVQLGVNPNTISRAYSDLDAKGIIVSAPGRGCFVSKDVMKVLQIKAHNRLPEFIELCRELKSSGTSTEELIEAVKNS